MYCECMIWSTASQVKLFFRLILQRDVVSSYLDSGRPVDEQGVEDAFELLHETNERVRTGIWVGDCFIYNNSSWRLNYCVGGEVQFNVHPCLESISICANDIHFMDFLELFVK